MPLELPHSFSIVFVVALSTAREQGAGLVFSLHMLLIHVSHQAKLGDHLGVAHAALKRGLRLAEKQVKHLLIPTYHLPHCLPAGQALLDPEPHLHLRQAQHPHHPLP